MLEFQPDRIEIGTEMLATLRELKTQFPDGSDEEDTLLEKMDDLWWSMSVSEKSQ